MKLLRNLVGCIAVSLMIAVGFRGVDLIESSFASSFDLAKQNALLRSVKIDTMSATWSGVIYQKNHDDGFLVLTIIHEDAMKELHDSGFPYPLVTLESGERHFAEVIAWDSCSEVAAIRLADNDRRYMPRVRINDGNLHYGESLFTFGHPLGSKLPQYAEGVITAKGDVIKECGLATNGVSSSAMPGATGSGVYDNDGRLIGLVIAVAAYELYGEDRNGNVVVVSKMPIPSMGRIVSADDIVKLLETNHLL